MLRGDNHSRMRSAFEELRELHRHGALIMGDEDSSIASRCFENVGILETPQAGIRRGPKLNWWLESKDRSENDVVQVLVRLKPDSQVRFAFESRASTSFW
jgi:succinate dehydrogenase/fumarate reductase flavoprotein subunit